MLILSGDLNIKRILEGTPVEEILHVWAGDRGEVPIGISKGGEKEVVNLRKVLGGAEAACRRSQS